MSVAHLSNAEQWDDLLAAVEFAGRQVTHWVDEHKLREADAGLLRSRLSEVRQQCETGRQMGHAVPRNDLLPGRREESAASKALRYWRFLEAEIRRAEQQGKLRLAEAHAILSEIREYEATLERRVQPPDLPRAILVGPPPIPQAPWAAPAEIPVLKLASQRSMLEILLDPKNIQILLGVGGALMVAGLVILLWVNAFFKPPAIALGLGLVNGALLALGWWVLRTTRMQVAGRALTLIACLIMPLNLWYYHANGLVTLDGHLWVAALVMSVLYAASAYLLRDETFVYIFMAGVALTGLLMLADLPPSPARFWEIALPATLLVVLGTLAIHVERAFDAGEGPFSRGRFGRAFFFSGHALLAAGLLLVLGAQIVGDWLYQPVFKGLFQLLQAQPSPIVGELRWLALTLVLLGAYVYLYSDLVVRRVGVYVYAATACIMWALVLFVQWLHLTLGVDALIVLLALTALSVNGLRTTLLRDSVYARAFPYLGMALPLLALMLAIIVYLRALSPELNAVWQGQKPSWSYVAALVLTALAARWGAYLYRHGVEWLTAAYFFVAGGATLLAVTALLAALNLETWQEHAPLLMLLPSAYLAAAQFYRGSSQEKPLVWVAHAATGIMLVSSLASAIKGFALIAGATLNLALALFFAEASLFYTLDTILYKRQLSIQLAAAMACGCMWQMLTYANVSAEFYTLTFALIGLALMLAYRFAVVEKLALGPLALATFQGANSLLSLSFVAAVLLGLSRLAVADRASLHWGLVGLFVTLTMIGLLTLWLVRDASWRRWYVVCTLGQAALTFLTLTVLSTLSPWQKLELYSVIVGVLMLVAGHIGWYREQDRENDLVSVALLVGSLLVGLPLALATIIDRSHDQFRVLNELGFLAASVLLLTTGVFFRLKSTSITGAGLLTLYFATLLILLPWSRLNAVALFILVGGGILFVLGLVLSVFRERLLTLPERIKRREGIFRVLSWR
jgi:hypothetical protein